MAHRALGALLTAAILGTALVATFSAASSEPLSPDEAARLARDPYRLLIGGESFDTRRGPDLPPALAARPDPDTDAAHYVVQFRGPIDRQARSVVESAGGTIYDYIPNHALLVRLAPAIAATVAAHPSVQWIGPFAPAYKLSPEIGRRTYSDPERAADHMLWLQIELFPDEDALAVAEAVRAAGGDVLATFDDAFTHRLHVRQRPEAVGALAHIRGVRWIEEFPEITLRNNTTRWVIQSNITNVTPLWDRGLHGEGQIVGHIDTRINRDSCFFRDPVNNTPGPDHRKLVSYRSSFGFGAASHGCHTGGTIAGDQEPINGTTTHNGIAYRARIAHADLNDIDGFGGGPSNLLEYLTLASNDGARVHTNSWGDDGTTAYTAWCRDIDLFSRQFEDDVVAFAVTNLSTLKTPENAKNCLAVGATQQAPNQANHGSGGTGPTIDGRRKPEIYSPGVGIISSTTGACGTTSSTGTSMACPSTTGSGALVRQYFEQGYYPTGTPVPADAFVPTGALTRATLMNATVDMTGVVGYPSNREGWGRLLADNTLFFDGDSRELLAFDVRHAGAGSLETGESAVHAVEITGQSPLKITLVFTDEAAALGAPFAPVNDLDLEVFPAFGTGEGYKGNVFANGFSTLGGNFDPLNTAEMVFLPTPDVGGYTIFVHARQVVDGTQGYALVISGDLPVTTLGIAGGNVSPGAHGLALSPIRPNPFTPSAQLEFMLPRDGVPSLEVYDATGRLVRQLLGGSLSAGAHSAAWDGRDQAGRPAPAGVYLVRLAQPGFDPAVTKAVLVR